LGEKPALSKGRYTLGPDKVRINIEISAGDARLLQFIQNELACGKADSIRTAIRVYSAILMQQANKKL